LSEALSEAERAVADSPSELWVHFGQVRLLLAGGQLSRARTVLDQAASLPAAGGTGEQAELRRLLEDLEAADNGSQGGAK
jgi:predicted Zn-dependent protease